MTQGIDHYHGQTLGEGPAFSPYVLGQGFFFFFDFFKETGILERKESQDESNDRRDEQKNTFNENVIAVFQKGRDAEKSRHGPGGIPQGSPEGDTQCLGMVFFDGALKNFQVHRSDRHAKEKTGEKTTQIK